jgi:parallel beta-helix repeat protein
MSRKELDMEHSSKKAVNGIFIFLVFIWLMPSLAEGQQGPFPQPIMTVRLTCNNATKIGQFLLLNYPKRLPPGGTLVVSGTCRENLLIPEHIQNITLEGRGTAQIVPSHPNENTINVRGRGIKINGFTIQGGFRAIAIQEGGAAIITKSVIKNAQTFGIQVSENSYARIIDNDIQNNTEDGINVRLGAGADIFDNRISGNRNGVDVDSGGSADISGNNISSNLQDGVHLRDNSHVRFSADPQNAIKNVIQNNGRDGVNCDRGGTISGRTPVDFGSGNTHSNKDTGNCLVAASILP